MSLIGKIKATDNIQNLFSYLPIITVLQIT